jgi:hypothetical protein
MDCPAPFLRPPRQITALAILSWLMLLVAVAAVPHLTDSPTLGDDLTRYTVRVALLYYGVAASLMLLLGPAEWAAAAGRGRLTRCCWTLAWLAYLIHLAAAFHYEHHWSHADAVARTERVSGFGGGVYVSHLFTLVWTMDVAYWWLSPHGYAARSPWVGRALHAFMVFMIFNATVVFETGPIRWGGALLLTWLALLSIYRFAQARKTTNQNA